ncbi:hypothetical protein BU17DRAFT_62765 [Hysterangium stoloniferum]|nr:hypothetical protein BU17DRAFT_62765 [Hysterangium stoloniferum]
MSNPAPLTPNPAPLASTLDGEHSDRATLPAGSESPKPGLQQEKEKHLHPLSLIVLSIWLCYIGLTIFFLESAVKYAPLHINRIWRYDILPGSMLTFFSQFHLPVTILHLARVGASAMERKHTALPPSPEFTRMTDRKWADPDEFGHIVKTMYKKKTRPSLIFFVFTLTCTIALVTPETLSRAYPVVLIDVKNATTTNPFTFSPRALVDVDQDTQIGLGLGSWATGQSIFQTYAFSVYSPDDTFLGDNDFFFAGIIENTVTLPGILLRGGCIPFFDDNSAAVKQDPTLFRTFCNDSLPPLLQDQVMGTNVLYGDANITFSYCTSPKLSIVFSGPDSNATAYIFFQTVNTTTTGMVMCQSNFTLGNATLSGDVGTYTDFQRNDTYDNSVQVRIADPLSAVLAGIANGSVANTHPFESESILVKQLGYNVIFDNGNMLNFSQPSLDELANQIWLGVAHMTAGIGSLSSTLDTSFPSTLQSSGRIRSKGFAIGAYTLLASWLCGLIFVSIVDYRRSSNSQLGSDAAVEEHRKNALRERRSGR